MGRFEKHKDLVCNYCHKKGHIKSECFKLKNKKEYKDKDEHDDKQKSIDANFGVDESNGDVLFVSDDKQCQRVSGF